MKKITYLLAAIVAVMTFYAPASAKTVLKEEIYTEGSATSANPVIDDIIRSYMPWTSAEFNGKLKYDKLLISATVKIYMVRDSFLQISARAPLLGEIGRLTLTPEELIIVNKMKRTYCKESARNLMEIYPSALSDIQSILLARVTRLGDGELDGHNRGSFSIEEDKEGGWLVIPSPSGGLADLRYGYVVGANSRTKALMATLSGQGTLQVRYTYPGRGVNMKIDFERSNKKKFAADLEFSSVKWGGSAMSPIKLDNYNRVSIKEFIGSLGK